MNIELFRMKSCEIESCKWGEYNGIKIPSQMVHYLLSYIHFTMLAHQTYGNCHCHMWQKHLRLLKFMKKFNGWCTHVPTGGVQVMLGYKKSNPYPNPSKTHQYTLGFLLPVPIPTQGGGGTGNFDMMSVFFFNNCSNPPPSPILPNAV